MSVKPIPEGYHTATPYLIIKNAPAALEFYKQAFGATELYRMAMPDGSIMHAEIRIGDSPIMMTEENPKMGGKGPHTLGGSPISIMLYVEDVDAVYQQALAAGASALRPVKDQFYGDRSGAVTDPFGHSWNIATHKEDVPPEEMGKRFREAMAKMAQSG